MIRWIKRRRVLPSSVIEVMGFAVFAAGVGIIYFPAGIIVAGLALVFIAQGVET